MEISAVPEKVKILFIEATAELEAGIPPNIAVLVSAVRAKGHEVRVFSTGDYLLGEKTGDDVRENTLQVPPVNKEECIYRPKSSDMVSDFLEIVAQFSPHIIGLSTTEATYTVGMKLLNAVRDQNIFTIVGGAHPTLCPDEVISEPSVQAVCVGEGEAALVELCDCFLKGEIDPTIQNLWFKDGKEVIKNPTRPLVDLDNIPFQDWTPWEIPPRASKAMAGKIRKTALIEFTRGCPYRCTYCANNFLNKQFPKNYRERSIDKFIEEIAMLQNQYGVEFIYIADETLLTTSEKRFSELVEKYKQVKLPFWCETRPEHITTEKIKKLMDIGLQAINVGLESGNHEYRKEYLNRNVSDERIIRGIHSATEAGTRVGANVIIGFPGQTRKHVMETIELVREAKPSSTMIHLFQPYRRTPMREKCVEMGLIDQSFICGDYRMDPIGTGYLSADELLGLQRTFNLYVDTPKDRWDEIREAENLSEEGNNQFGKLAKAYQLRHFGKSSF